MLDNAEMDQWLFRRDSRVNRPLATLTGQIGGIPYLAVEVQLLYKAREHDLAKNDADFRACVPRLSADQKHWLVDALDVIHPGHVWIEALAS